MDIKFKWIGAACFTLEVNNTFKIACDPCLSHKGSKYDFKFFKSERIEDPVYSNADFENVDLWLLTHRHEDHIDKEGLEYLKNDSKKIIQKGLTKILADQGVKNYDTLAWGQDLEMAKNGINVKVTAVPAVHGSNALSSYLAGEVNGYWVTIAIGEEIKTLYLTGDTVCGKKLEKFIGNKLCDVMLPNMGAVMKGKFGGPLTLDDKMLDHMIDCLEPLVVLPVHYGCFSHYSKKFPDVNMSHKAIVRRTKRGKSLNLTI